MQLTVEELAGKLEAAQNTILELEKRCREAETSRDRAVKEHAAAVVRAEKAERVAGEFVLIYRESRSLESSLEFLAEQAREYGETLRARLARQSSPSK